MKQNKMKNQSLTVISLLLFNFAVAGGVSFAQGQAASSSPDSNTATTMARKPGELKAQLKADRKKLRADIKASGKNSDAVKADRAQIKQDKDAIVSQKAKKSKVHTPSSTQQNPQAPSQPSS